MSSGGSPAYLDIPNDTLDYYIGWGLSARVSTILNIANPASTGLSCFSKIPKNNVYKNSNPVYLNSPVSFFCVGRTSSFNQNANDPDGDSLSFSIAQPYNVSNTGNACNPFPAPTPPNFVYTTNPAANTAGYSFPTAPLGSASTVTINAATGEILVDPAAVGVYIIAVVVKEYRLVSGVYTFLCETRRDIQIQTGNCSTTNYAPSFTSVIPIKNADTTADQVVTAGDTLCFNIKFKDPNSGDSLFTSFTGPIFNGSAGLVAPYATLTQDTAKDSVISNFCWFTQCPHARQGSPYIFTINVKDNQCNEVQKTFSILVNPKAVLSPPNIRCVDILNNDSIKLTFTKPSYLKDFDKYYLYRRTGTSGNCTLIDSIQDSTVLTYIDSSVSSALSVSYGYTLRTRSTCSVYGKGCDTVNSIIVTAAKVSDHCTSLTWTRHRQNTLALYKVYRIVGATKILVDSTRNNSYLKCDCNTAGKFSIEVDDTLVSCTSHSNITAVFTNMDTTAPKPVVIKRSTVNSTTQIQVDFPKSDSADAFWYIIYRSSTASGFTLYDSINAVAGTTMYNYLDNSPINSGPYYYRVQVKDSCGNRSTISASHSPVDLTGTNANAMSKLNWVKKYYGYSFTNQILQKQNTANVWVNYKTLSSTDTSYDDTVVVSCSVYYYRLKTINSADTSIFSYSDSVRVQPFDTIRPAVPNVRYISVTGPTSVTLVFDTSAAMDTKTYMIYGAINGGAFALIDSLIYPATRPISYTWIGRNPQLNTYKMYVVARDSCGNNLSSSSVAHTHVQLNGTAGNLKNTLSWTNYVGRTPATYALQRYELGSGSGWATIKTLNYPDTACVDSINIKGCYPYAYRIVTSFTGFTFTSISDTIALTPFDLIAPSPPTINYVSVVNNTSNKVVVTKSDSLDVNRYEIYFKSATSIWRSAGIVYYPIGNPFVFIHTGVSTLDSNYSYYVRAIDSCGSNYSTATSIHTTIQLRSTSGAMTNFLSWTKYQGWTPTSYKVLRLIGGTWTVVKTLTSNDTIWADTTNLKCNQPNSYKVCALNNFSDTSFSDTTIVTPYDTIHPAIPFLRSVSVINNTSVTITLNKVADQDVNRYQIWFATNNGAFSLLTTIFYPTTNPFSYTQTGLNTLSNTYRYYVVAIDSCSNNVSQQSIIHRTINLQSTTGAMTNFLYWNRYEGWSSVSNYTVLRLIGGTWTVVKTLTGADTAWADTANLKCNQPNSYRLLALNALNDSSYSDTTVVTPYDTIHPAIPFLRSVSVVNNTSVTITLNKVADQDVNRYQIWVATNNGAFSLLTTIFYPTTNPFSYTQTGLNTLSNNYRYYVLAYDSCSNNVSQSSVIHTDIQLSSSPGNLTSKLSWTKYKGFGVGEYRVLRLIGGTWTFIQSLSGTDSTFNDTTNIGCNYTYAYRVLAINTSTLDTSYSDTTMVTPFDTIKPDEPFINAVTVASNSSVTITWAASNPDVNKFRIYRKNSLGIYVLIDSVYYTTTYTDRSAQPHTTIEYYKIQAVDSCAQNKSILSAPHRTIKLGLAFQKCPRGIVLNWNDYQTWTSGISSYEIYRSDSINAEVQIGSVAGGTLTYTDTFIVFSRTYNYRIKAIQNGGSEISWSDSTQLVTPKGEGPYIDYVTVLSTDTLTGTIKIQWNALRYNGYVLKSRLYYSPSGLPGSYTILLDNIPLSVNSFTHTNLNTKLQSHYYYMVSIDSCNRMSDSMSLHRSINLVLIGGQLINVMHWSAYIGWTPKYYILERASQIVTSFADIDTIPATDTTYMDFPAPCNVDLYYRIKAISFDGFVSVSDTAITVAIDTLPPDLPVVKNATVWANGVNRIDFMTADSTDVYGYALYRKRNNGNWFNIKFTQFAVRSVPYTIYDSTANTLLDYNQYVLLTIDSCLNVTPSDTFNIIQLRGNPSERKNVLYWHPFRGYQVDTFQVQKWNGSTWVNFRQVVKDTNCLDSPLLCNSLHYYRIWAKESNGTRVTISDSIRLIPFDSIHPQPVIIDYATVLNNTQIGLRWRLTDADAKDYIVQRKTNNGPYVPIVTLFNYPITYTDNVGSTLQNEYSYRLIAYDTCSQNRSDTIIFHTAIQLQGIAQNTQATLNWNAYVGFGNITKYYIQKFIGGSWQIVDSVSGTTTTYVDLNLPCAQLQRYRILANDTNHVYFTLSDTLNVTPFDTIKPAAPFLRSVSVVSNSSVNMIINKVPDQDVNRYQIWVATNNGAFSLLSTIYYPTTDPFSFTQTGLNTLSNTYRYYVLAIDSCRNNISAPSIIHRTINLRSIGGAMTNFLYWNRYEGWSSVAGYSVLRLIGANWTLVKTLAGTDTAWADTVSLKCNQPNSYRIYAFNASLDTSYSDTTVVTPYDTIHPAIPFLRSVSVVNNTSVTITLNKVADQDVNRYQIWVATNNGAFSLLTTLVYPTTDPFSFTQTGLNTLSNTYRYYVTAIDSCSDNISQWSEIHRTINLRSIGGAMTNFLYWNRYEKWSSISGYNVLRLIGANWTLVKTLAGTDTAWADTASLKCNQPNSYRIYAFNASLDTSYSDTTVVTPYDTIHPAIPFLRSVSVVNNTSVTITLNKVADQDVNRYQIWVATNNGAFSLLTTLVYPTTDPFSFTQTGLNTLSNTYRYYVTAIDSCSDNISQWSEIHRTINLRSIGGAMTNFLYWNRYEKWSAISGYNVLRLISNNWTLVKTLAGTDTAWADTVSLKCNQPNSYRIYAFNASLDTSYSDTTVVTPYDTIRPKSPIIRFVSVTSASSIHIEFDSVMDQDVNRYQIFESVNGGAFSLIAILSAYTPNPLTYDRTGISTMNNHYYYYIVAIDSCSNNISLSGPRHGEVEIKGTAGNMRSLLKWHPYKGFSSKFYNVQRLNAGAWTTIGSIINNDTIFTDTANISCNVNYYYRIQTVDLSNNAYVSISDSVMVTPYDTVKPVAALLKYVTVTSSNSVKVKWDLSASGDVKFYEVHRISPGGFDSYVGTAIYTDTFIDNTVIAQQNSYCYYVIAIDSCNILNRSPKSNTLCTIDLQVIITPGCVPLSHLKWTPCQSFDELPVPNYEIWRTINGIVWNKIRTVPSSDSAYTDSTVTLAKTYCYVIRAFNTSLSYATLSDSECVIPELYPPLRAPELDVATVTSSSVTAGKIVLRWKALPLTDTLARGYRIYHSTSGAVGSYTLLVNIPNRNAFTYTHLNMNSYSSENYYFIVAYDKCNFNGDTSVVHHAVNISILNGNLSETVSWNKYLGYKVKEYEIFKSYDGVNYFTLAKNDSLTLFITDTQVSCGKRYWYSVKAIEEAGDNEIAFSDIDSVLAFDTIPPFPIVIKQATVSIISKVVGEITLTYNSNTERNRKGYKIYRSINGAAYTLLSANLITSTGLHIYKDQGLNTLESIYSYYIRVIDSCGNEGAPSDIHTAVNVTAVAYNSSNTVSWTGYEGFTNWHYIIERYTSTNPVWVAVGGGIFNKNAVTWNDSAIICDVMYYYRLKTFDDNDISANSMSDTSGCLGFETYPPNIPVFLRATVTKSSKSKGEIQLDWIHSTSSDAINYFVYRRTNGVGAWTFVAQTGYVNTFTDVNLNTSKNVYDYRIECLDNCRNMSAPTPPHATINLTTVPGNTRVFLSWTNYLGFIVDQYEIYADGVLIDNVPATQLNYEDSMLSCDTAVVYQIKALELNGNTQVSYSDTSIATPYDIIPPVPVYIIAASVEQPENLVKLQWTPMPEWDGDHYNIYRKSGGSGWLRIYTGKSPYETSYTDKGVNAADTNIYYKISPTDNCYNTGDYSNVAKTILLRGSSEKLMHKLWWTNYSVWNAGVAEYDIIRTEDTGFAYVLATVNNTDTIYIDNDFTTSIHNYCYYIKAHEKVGSYDAESNSNIVCLSQHPVIWIPNAFSPGSSPNLNDVFKPTGLYFDKYEERIYNRWGELLFKSTPLQPAWDGMSRGKLVPEDTYIYSIKVTGFDHKEYEQNGTVTIVK